METAILALVPHTIILGYLDAANPRTGAKARMCGLAIGSPRMCVMKVLLFGVHLLVPVCFETPILCAPDFWELLYTCTITSLHEITWSPTTLLYTAAPPLHRSPSISLN